MKLLISLLLIVGVGIALMLLALTRQTTELETTQLPTLDAHKDIATPTPVSAPQEAAAPAGETQQSVPSQGITPSATPATDACLSLEDQLKEELDDATQELNRKTNEYDDTVETYEDALGEASDDVIQSLREDKDIAQEEYEDAQSAYDRAVKRLSRARVECGLFQ